MVGMKSTTLSQSTAAETGMGRCSLKLLLLLPQTHFLMETPLIIVIMSPNNSRTPIQNLCKDMQISYCRVNIDVELKMLVLKRVLRQSARSWRESCCCVVGRTCSQFVWNSGQGSNSKHFHSSFYPRFHVFLSYNNRLFFAHITTRYSLTFQTTQVIQFTSKYSVLVSFPQCTY